jgi:hypothetical protein
VVDATLARLTRLPVQRYGIPGPDEVTRARIEGPHDTGGHIDAVVVCHECTDHDDVVEDEWSGGRVVLPGLGTPDSLAQRNAAAFSKVRTQLAGLRIDGEQLGIPGAVEDTPLARAALLGSARLPVRDAPAVQRVGTLGRAVLQPRVEAPDLLTRFGVQREDPGEGRAVVEQAVDHEGRHLVLGARSLSAAVVDVSASVHPRDLEVVDVLRGDLGKGRVVGGALVPTPEEPLGRRARVVELG